MKYFMLTAALLALASLIAVGQALPDKEISVPLNSSIELQTDFNISVIEVTWKHTNPNNGKKLKIIKIQNGNVTSIVDDRYSPDINGRNLVINNPTENDSGVYRIEVTLLNGTLVTQTINVTLSDPVQITQEVNRNGNKKNETSEPSSVKMKKRNRMYVIIPVIVIPAVFGAILWKCWKRSSATSRRGGQNETLMPPVQDTETQESLFIDIPRRKIGMKIEETDEEMWMKLRECGEPRVSSSVRRIPPRPEVELEVNARARQELMYLGPTLELRPSADNMETIEVERDTPVPEISRTSADVQSEVADEEPVASVSPASNISSTSTTLETGQANSFSPGTTSRDAAASPGAATAVEPTAGHGC
ncbi:hypothetical protein GDO78_020618 [Eleutherodactylus coqui]|uniref:Immunoglobulin domain-containing protein n=1 Tax=Eleutherodactylus coqui TaxID=57060 RepID=A0A8J6JT93_ELECQ|nr:hypothetical protein GDO78_020618 [Eleutherodactylus coqui]